MKVFFKIFLMIMGLINVVAGFVLGEMLNVALGTAFIIMWLIYSRKVK